MILSYHLRYIYIYNRDDLTDSPVNLSTQSFDIKDEKGLVIIFRLGDCRGGGWGSLEDF